MSKFSLFACLAILVATIAIASAYYGQDIYAEPECSIVTDKSRKFRDINDPTHYWVCSNGAQAADYIQCPDNEAFMEDLQRCVEWENWKWLEPYPNA